MKNRWQHTTYARVDESLLSEPCPAKRPCGWGLPVWVFLLASLLVLVGANVATAKSVYVIADVEYADLQVRVEAYDIAPSGKLTFQAEGRVPLYGARPLGLALDSDSRHLFLTCLTSNVITLLDGVTLEGQGTVRVEGARSLMSVVYDHSKGLLYCVDGLTPNLYVYRWSYAQHELTPAPGSPFRLDVSAAHGLALDEGTGELYVTDSSASITVYNTLDWRLTNTITVGRPATHVAVDPLRGYLYYGAADLGNFYLGKYDPATGTEVDTRIGNQIGVMGLAVDKVAGFVFVTTGRTNCPGCGDDLCVYSGELTLIDAVRKIGEPTAVTVSDGRTAYNPLRLTKTIKVAEEAKTGAELSQVIVGEEVAYAICFDHNDLPLTNIVLVDKLPAEIAFVRATGDGVYGRYDPQTHSYTWSNPPLSAGATTCLELVGRLDPNTPVHQLVSNSVTIDCNETPPTTSEAYIVAMGPKVYKPLHVNKAVIAGASGAAGALLTRPGDELTYRITFDNQGNEYAVEKVFLTDTLPPETEFVRATGDRTCGRYEPATHTYTWSYASLAPGESNSVDLVVRVDSEAEIGATIHNGVMLVSQNTTAVTASVDVTVASFAPLRLQKTLVRGAVGQSDKEGRPYVDAGSTLTYAIYFSNPSANKTVTDISIVDTLPRELSFISADGSRDLGFYDPNTHTYTWHYTSLGSGLEQTLNLTVRVNDAVSADTVISNSVAITAKQTETTRVCRDVVVRDTRTELPLRLQKTLVKGGVPPLAGSARMSVYPGTELTYALSFSNPAANTTATQISLVDTLPRDVTFVRADDDREFGSYDAGTHTYTWRYALLAPGAEKVLNLVVRVNDDVAPGTVITNAVTIRPGEMPPTTDRVEVVVTEPPTTVIKCVMYIKPNHIYRNDPRSRIDLMVVVHLPEGIGPAAISNTTLVLTPGNVKATGQQIFGSSTQGKVLGFFAVEPILAATQGYGEFPLKVTGQLKDGRAFVGETTISILKFGGP